MKALAFGTQQICTRLLRTLRTVFSSFVVSLGLLALSLCMSMTVSAQTPTVLRVNQNAPASSLNNGSSWANAFTNLQAAIAAAQPSAQNPVQIWIARGTYYPTSGTDRTASFHLKSNLILEGGFNGTETNDNQSSVFFNPTVLSGDIGRPQRNKLDANNIVLASVPFDPNDPGAQDNCYNVVTGNNVVGVVLDNLYITGGYANAGNSVVSQATLEGMSLPIGPTVQDTSFPAPSVMPLDSRVAGGGLCFVEPDGVLKFAIALTINNCVFENNGARGYGGAIACKWAAVRTGGVVIQNNYAGEEGGAFWAMNCVAEFEAVSFETNKCAGAGGALVYRSCPSTYNTDLGNAFTPFQ
ncbi:MAG TPA: hypothetical protein VFC07_12985, partial [Verrucomicrobiae bacterium]|nr:hypothetical protein [Verrucomicrobiae bacterium]